METRAAEIQNSAEMVAVHAGFLSPDADTVDNPDTLRCMLRNVEHEIQAIRDRIGAGIAFGLNLHVGEYLQDLIEQAEDEGFNALEPGNEYGQRFRHRWALFSAVGARLRDGKRWVVLPVVQAGTLRGYLRDGLETFAENAAYCRVLNRALFELDRELRAERQKVATLAGEAVEGSQLWILKVCKRTLNQIDDALRAGEGVAR